jgi:uncharacterized protein
VTRRSLLTPLLSAGAVGAYARYVEPGWFQVTRTSVRIRGVRPFRLLHLSDLHISDGITAEELASAIRMGLAEKPDIVCMTGDYVSSTTGFDADGLHRVLRMAASAVPVFAVVGNHDGGKWMGRWGGEATSRMLRGILTAAGAHVLHNRHAEWNGVQFIGTGDLYAEEFDGEAAFRDAKPNGPSIVLCHNPDGKDKIEDRKWDLMLSGHTHGGQVRLRGLPAPWAPVHDKRYLAGLYGWQGRQLFITRGVGSPKHVRLGSRPEVSILEISGS